MWVGIQAATGAALIGTALVVAGLHGAHGSVEPAAALAPAAAVYRPPANPLPDTSLDRVRIAPVTRKPAAPRHSPASSHKRAAIARRPKVSAAHAAPRRTAAPAKPAPPQQSFGAALAAAVARIPTYTPGAARWVVSSKYDFWGTADWYHDVLYVSPDVPRDKLYDVAVHEWSHELSVLDYGGDVSAATKAMNAWFGGSGLVGAERAADCMAILQGATWTHYTTCDNATWRKGAAKLVAGKQL
ncbi:MAG TPA: hypothetical protein VFH54_01110 [Mycobacteriales bacterium]|nr:hypothetical protein [Mycobacteriales bacterium]